MTILQINKFHYIQGGADRHYLDLINLLQSKGHKVIPFSMQNKKNLPSPYQKYFVSFIDLAHPKISWSSLKTTSRIIYSWEARHKIQELIQKEKPEIAHIHNIYHQISPSILGVLKEYKIPIVMTVHDYKLICPNYKLFNRGKICEKCKKRKYYQCILNKCVKDSYLASALNTGEVYFHKIFRFYEKYVDVFICPSQFMKDKLASWGLPGQKLTVLPHFIQPAPKSLSFPEKNYVLFFGRLSSEKGLDLLISVAQKLPHIPFKIVGEGEEKERLAAYTKRNEITNVKFLGYKHQNQLKKIILASRFVVVPSRWQEVFGLIVLESFNLGKAVIASRKGGIPELVRERETGFLFQNEEELKEKIEYLYHHPDLAKKMGKKVKAQIRKYSPHIYYQKLTKIYKNLLI